MSYVDGLVVIDPGHGGYDSGAIGPGYAREADINLEAGLILADLLAKRGIPWKITRTTDTYVPLTGRASLANVHGARAFISLHANAAERVQAHGFEVWTSPGFTGADPLALRIIDKVAVGMDSVTVRRNKGADGPDKEARFVVLTHTNMPAVLIEMGFISNAEEVVRLQSPTWLGKLMTCVADGLCSWLDDPQERT